MKKESNKKSKIFRHDEYFVTVCIFLVMMVVILAVFFTVTYAAKLSAVQSSVDNVSEYMVASYTRYIDEINTVSKQTFISEDMMACQDSYLVDGNNDSLYSHVAKQFEVYNSSLIVGMGYIPFESDGYACQDIVYSKVAVWKELLPDTIAMVGIFVVVLVLFSFFYKRTHDKYTSSFVYLIEQFQSIDAKTDLTPIALTKDDENVNQVIATYNHMVSNVLAERIKNETLSEENRQIELQRLYQQINKHFVINVLTVAHSLIVLDKRDKANDCIENLADFLRYSLSINVTEVPLQDEIASVLSYINLQKLRFPNVEFSSSVSGKVDDVVVPKFIIQPLVENAYVHGIKNKNGSIDLIVQRTEDKLTIKVVNSALEIDARQLEEVNKRMLEATTTEHFSENGHGIALKNIRKRLQLKFAFAKVLWLQGGWQQYKSYCGSGGYKQLKAGFNFFRYSNG